MGFLALCMAKVRAGFGTSMITFWKGDNHTSGTLSNLHGMVSTLHIADNNLIEVLNGVEYTLQEFLSIVGVDNN